MLYQQFLLARTKFSIYLDVFLLTRLAIYIWFYQLKGSNQNVRDKIKAATLSWAKNTFAHVNCKVEVEGLENIPHDGGVVIMVNHQSEWDVTLLMGFLERSLGWVVKKELFYFPVLSFVFRRMNCYPLDRGNAKAGFKAYQQLGKALKDKGHDFVIFPEGTRTKDPAGRVQPFKRGSLRLASDNNLPVLPVSIDGTRLLDNAAALYRTRKKGRFVRMRILPPVQTGGLSAPERAAFMDMLHETISSNRETIKVEWPEN